MKMAWRLDGALTHRLMSTQVTKNNNEGQAPADVPASLKLDAPFVAHVKGAPNYILEACTTYLDEDGKVVPLDEANKKRLYEKVDELSGQALRVLAISCRPLDELPYADDGEVEDKLTAVLDGGLQFIGLVASIDPERQGVKDAIEEASHASVRTVMITGDYLKTVPSQRPAVPRRLRAIFMNRLRERRSWVVSFSILRPFGPSRGTTMM